MSAIVVSAADSDYFPLLNGLVRSVRECPEGRDLPIGILDLGMKPEQVDWLLTQVDEVVEPEWDFSFPNRSIKSPNFRAQTARPFLPKYFPDHEFVLWLDADTWVQSGAVLTYFQEAARGGKLAIVPELNRCYEVNFSVSHTTAMYNSYKSVFGEDVAKACGFNPVLNSGAFCMRRDLQHWQQWQNILREALQRTQSFYVEQFALNVAVYTKKLPVHYLSGRCNWMCHHAIPSYSESRGKFVEPRVPNETVLLVHLTDEIKQKEKTVQVLEGGEFETSLAYHSQLPRHS